MCVCLLGSLGAAIRISTTNTFTSMGATDHLTFPQKINKKKLKKERKKKKNKKNETSDSYEKSNLRQKKWIERN